MIRFNSIRELVALAEEQHQAISAVVWQYETERSTTDEDQVWQNMKASLAVMRSSIATGLNRTEKSFSGLVGGDAHRLMERLGTGKMLGGEAVARAAAYALAVSEINAGMGKIVACPTAGSCGIVPGVLLAGAEVLKCEEDDLVRALFTAAGIGLVIEANASIAGAKGGCQAECGSAAAMAAAAVTEMAGGTPTQCAQALALALKNMLGLVCDPVAGLVEVPCVKRNAFSAVHALLAADMALAGVESVIPADEVIEAMYRIGLTMPESLRETSEGGLACTPTGLRLKSLLQGTK